MNFDLLNSENVVNSVKKHPVALLPIGAIEAHGAHLPLGTDNYLAEALCQKIVAQLPAYVLPTIPYGQVWSLQNFPGSFHIPSDVLESYLFALAESVMKNNFKLLVFINAHLGNNDTIKQVQRKIVTNFPSLHTLNLFYPSAEIHAKEVLEQKQLTQFFHADELETSYMLYLCSSLVSMEKAINGQNFYPSDISYRPIPWDEFTKTPVMGNATLATKKKGEYILNKVLEKMICIIKEHFKQISGE